MSRPRSPLLDRYVAALPNGLASYPFVEVKGSVVRTMVTTCPIQLPAEELPEELAELLKDPPLPNVWASEVKLNALGLAIQDRISKEQHDAWVYQRNRRIITHPLYKILFWMVSPERIFTGMANRFGAFRRGTELQMLGKSEKSARLRLVYPPHLHDEPTLANVATAFRVVAEAAGAVTARAEVEQFDATSALFALSWS